MFDEKNGENLAQKPGYSGPLDLADFGDFASAAPQAIRIDGLLAPENLPGAIENGDALRLSEILEAIDNAEHADLQHVPVPVDMITQFYQQF
jgi:hypothetical protein